MSRVAMLGTGIMGAGMTRNLVRAGHEVRAWNRSREKAERLGAEVADSPADAARDAEVVVTMLSRGEVVREVIERAREGVPRGAAWAQMSTVGAEATRELAALAEEMGVAYVDAPVLGTRQPAEQGQLVVLASGPAEAKERCRGVFDAVGSKVIDRGEEPGVASDFKLVLNTWVFAVTEGAAETLALARSLGIDGQDVLDAFAGGGLDLPYLRLKGGAMLSGTWEPSFPLALAHKDVRLALGAAEREGLELPALRGTEQAFARAEDAGHGEEDMAATYRGLTGA